MPVEELGQKKEENEKLKKKIQTISSHSHLCVCGCSLPRHFGRGSVGGRRTQTLVAGSDPSRT